MGCGSVSKPNQSVWLNAFNQKFRYRVKVNKPDGECLEFVYEDQFDEMPLTTLMNLVSFNEKDLVKFDSNFISIRDNSCDSFKYFIQRLVGVERDEEKGMEWVLYINKNKYSWDEICQVNLKVKPEEHLVCVYQKTSETKFN